MRWGQELGLGGGKRARGTMALKDTGGAVSVRSTHLLVFSERLCEALSPPSSSSPPPHPASPQPGLGPLPGRGCGGCAPGLPRPLLWAKPPGQPGRALGTPARTQRLHIHYAPLALHSPGKSPGASQPRFNLSPTLLMMPV